MYWFQRWFEKIAEALHSESSTIQETVKSQRDSIREDRETANREQGEAAKIIARAINTASYNTSSYERAQRDKEYGLQKWLVLLTFFAAGGAIVAAIASVNTLPAIKESADAANKSAQTSAKQLEMAERPWMSIEPEIISPLSFDKEGAQIWIRATIKNLGHSPALRVSEGYSIYGSFLNTPDPRIKLAELCKQELAESSNAHNISNGFLGTRFPGEQPEIFPLRLDRKEIQLATRTIPHGLFPTMPLGGHFEILIAYCIAYSPSFSDIQYHTGYVFDLVRKVKTPPFENALFNEKNGTVPLSELMLHYNWIAGNGPNAN